MSHPRFAEILKELQAIHEAKNHDYGGGTPFSNF